MSEVKNRGRAQFQKLRPALAMTESLVRHLPVRARRALLRARPNSNSKLARATRYLAIRSLARACGELVDIRSTCVLLAIENLELGSRISIHPFCYIDATGSISIGDDVSIAHAVTIMSTNHVYDDMSIPIRDQGVVMAKTTIANDVWIGAGARILAGVTVGSGAVIAAGAIVTKDVPERSIVAGVPARVIKSR